MCIAPNKITTRSSENTTLINIGSKILFQVMDQLDKKKKVVTEQQTKGEKLTQDPKAPKFLITYIDRLKALWVDANKQAEIRLAALKGDLEYF